MNWGSFWNIFKIPQPQSPQVNVVPSAAVKGQIAEIWVEEALSSKFTVIRHKKNKSGDLKLTSDAPAKVVLIEVKHYSGEVPVAEVEKFYRDLEATSWDAGIFVDIKEGSTGASYRYYRGFPCLFLRISMGDANGAVLRSAVELFLSFLRRENRIGENEVNWRLMNEFSNKLSDLSGMKMRLSELGTEMERLGYQMQQFVEGYKRLVGEIAENVAGVEMPMEVALEERANSPAICKELVSRLGGTWKILKTCVKSSCGKYVIYFRKDCDELYWGNNDKKIILSAIEIGAGYKESQIILQLDSSRLNWFFEQLDGASLGKRSK